MGLYRRSRLKALPILNPAVASVRSIISRLICISEPPLHAVTGTITVETALDKLSDVELEARTRPENLISVSEAMDYMANREAECSEYLWKRQGDCLFLLATSEFARSQGVPGVAFEFVTRTGPSVWTVRQVPDPADLLGCPVHFERNELVGYSQRPSESAACCRPQPSSYRLYRVGRFVSRVATTLFA